MNAKPALRIISGSSSVLLDGLRLFSALVVVYVHAHDQWFPTSDIEHHHLFRKAAHSAVVYFFVISGFVISYTTINNNRGSLQYAKARLSRLYAILLPALIVTAMVQVFVAWKDPILLQTFSRSSSLIRYILSSLYLNEVWTLSAAPPINIALWSLSFEFWYYAIFGYWMYRKRGAGIKSYFPVILACLVAGPKILLMMPIWLIGYFAYTIPPPKMSTAQAWAAVMTFLVAGIIVIVYVMPFPYDIGTKPFYFANRFLTDYLVGLCFGAALWLLPLGNTRTVPSSQVVLFRKIADLTFPIYVLHYPLLVLWRAFQPRQINNSLQLWTAIFCVLIVSSVIGLILERQRKFWVDFFGKLLSFIRERKLLLNRILNA